MKFTHTSIFQATTANLPILLGLLEVIIIISRISLQDIQLFNLFPSLQERTFSHVWHFQVCIWAEIPAPRLPHLPLTIIQGSLKHFLQSKITPIAATCPASSWIKNMSLVPIQLHSSFSCQSSHTRQCHIVMVTSNDVLTQTVSSSPPMAFTYIHRHCQ